MKECRICCKEIREGEDYYGQEDADNVDQPVYLHPSCGLEYVQDLRNIVQNWNQMVADAKRDPQSRP